MRFLPFKIALLTLVRSLAAAPDDLVTLEIVVTPPTGISTDARLFLAGNTRALGGWSPAGVALERGKDGLYRTTLRPAKGEWLELKVTGGSWDTVELSAEGKEVPNRTVRADKDDEVKIQVAGLRDGSPRLPRRSTVTGNVKTHEKFKSKLLENERTISVYLPPGYDADSLERYPVLYLHDGQNLFDEKRAAFGVEWKVDETAERLIRSGRVRPLIIVGIDNTAKRVDEYTPTRIAEKDVGGLGARYERFVVEEVKPFIDRTYRTAPGRENNAVAGSSLGGLISLHMAREHHEVFSACAALSPAIWWDDRQLLREWRLDLPRLKGTRYWIDIGTHEGVVDESSVGLPRAVEHCRELLTVLDAAGLLPGRDYYYTEVALAAHNETAWSARFDKVLLFLFGK